MWSSLRKELTGVPMLGYSLILQCVGSACWLQAPSLQLVWLIRRVWPCVVQVGTCCERPLLPASAWGVSAELAGVAAAALLLFPGSGAAWCQKPLLSHPSVAAPWDSGEELVRIHFPGHALRRTQRRKDKGAFLFPLGSRIRCPDRIWTITFIVAFMSTK